MNKSIDKIIERLKKHPKLQYDFTDTSIIIKPKEKNGFPVSLTVNMDNQFTVEFDFWHEEFSNEDEAIKCFFFGLTKDCRLKLTKRGERPFKWTVEYKDIETWKEDSTTGFFNLAFWRQKNIEYLQNDLI